MTRVTRLLGSRLAVVGVARRWHDAMLLSLVALLATWIRIPPIITESVWLDEMFTRRVVLLPPRSALAVIREDKVHPPLFYAVEKVVVSLFGDGQTALRLVSLLCSVLLVIVAGLFARELTRGSRWAMLSTAILVAISDFQIYHAMNARSYALYALVVLLTGWAFHRMITHPERGAPKIAYGAMALIGVVTHYLVVLYLIALGPAVLVAPRRREAMQNWILWSLPAAAAMAVWWWWLGRYDQISDFGGLNWIARPSLGGVASVAAVLIGRPYLEIGSWPVLLYTGILALLVVRARRGVSASDALVSKPGVVLVSSVVLIPPALLLVLSILARQSFWLSRQLAPSQAFVAIALGIGLAVVARVRPAFAAAGIAGLVILNDPGRLIGSPAPRNAPYNRVAEDLRNLRAPGEQVVATRTAAIWSLNYYLAGPDTAQFLRIDAPRNEGWVGRPFPALADSSLRGIGVLWLVVESSQRKELDSLARTGWRLQEVVRYPAPERPDLTRLTRLSLVRLSR